MSRVFQRTSVRASANSAIGASAFAATRNSGSRPSMAAGRLATSGSAGATGSRASRSHSAVCGRSASRIAYRTSAAQSMTSAGGR